MALNTILRAMNDFRIEDQSDHLVLTRHEVIEILEFFKGDWRGWEYDEKCNCVRCTTIKEFREL